MKIETKFDNGEFVFTIDSGEIVRLPIIKIEASCESSTRIKYTLLKCKALNFGDPDSVIVKIEGECFKSLSDMLEYYDQRFNKNK